MTKVTLIALLAGVVSITTGCAFSWVKDGVNEEDTQRDLARCKQQEDANSIRGRYDTLKTDDILLKQKLIRLCMEEEGYKRK